MESNEQQSRWYYKINNTKIPISKETYIAIAQHTQHIRYIAKREGRCSMSRYVQCTGDCSRCSYRKEGTTVSLDCEGIEKSLVANAACSPEELVLREETWRLVFRCADEVAKHGKDITRLRFITGLNTHQIAKELSIPYSTIEYRLARILSALRNKQKEIF